MSASSPTARCSSCGAENVPGVRVCSACGHALAAQAPAAPPSVLKPRQAAPMRPASTSALPPPTPAAAPAPVAVQNPAAASSPALTVDETPLPPTEQVPPPRFDDVPVRSMKPMGARPPRAASRVTLTSWWRALGAGLVELLLVVVPAAGVGFLAAENRSIASAPSVVEGVALTLATETRALVAFAICAFALHVLHSAVTIPELGGTLGDRVFGLRVASRFSGRRLGLARAALRGVFSALGALLCFAGPLFGVFVDPLRRGLGDLVAGTVLIRPPFVEEPDGDAGDGG